MPLTCDDADDQAQMCLPTAELRSVASLEGDEVLFAGERWHHIACPDRPVMVFGTHPA